MPDSSIGDAARVDVGAELLVRSPAAVRTTPKPGIAELAQLLIEAVELALRPGQDGQARASVVTVEAFVDDESLGAEEGLDAVAEQGTAQLGAVPSLERGTAPFRARDGRCRRCGCWRPSPACSAPGGSPRHRRGPAAAPRPCRCSRRRRPRRRRARAAGGRRRSVGPASRRASRVAGIPWRRLGAGAGIASQGTRQGHRERW